MASGIYAIIHRDSGRWYVGQSGDIGDRWRRHMQSLNKGGHHSPHLQRVWTKYGSDAFDFETLILAPVHLLNDLEQAYLDDPETSHFNVARDAQAVMRGRTHSPEARAKIGAAGRGRPVSDETLAKRSAALRGLKRTP